MVARSPQGHHAFRYVHVSGFRHGGVRRIVNGRAPFQHIPEVFARISLPGGYNFLRRSRGYHMAAACAAFRPQVDHVVRGFDEFRVVLDDQQGVPLLHQFPEHGQQNFNIGKVKSRSRLVQNQHLGAVRAGSNLVQQDFSQLQPLVFPAGESVQRLPQGQVPQPYALKHAQLGSNAGGLGPFFRSEVFQRSRHRHAEHIRNVPAVAVHAQHFTSVPGAVAQRALHEDI